MCCLGKVPDLSPLGVLVAIGHLQSAAAVEVTPSRERRVPPREPPLTLVTTTLEDLLAELHRE